MALLGSSSGYDAAPIVRGRGVVLRMAQVSDYPAWAELRAASREHLMPWEPQWSRDELTRTSFRRRVRHYQREAREDVGYAFLIFSTVDNAASGGMRRGPASADAFDTGRKLVGGVTLTNVRRGVTQAATLGYWLGKPHVGRGHMHAALQALLPFAFDVLRLHRIEAAVMPANVASLRVLERLGFQREGLARRYLKIRGIWEDHFIHALLADEFDRVEGGVA